MFLSIIIPVYNVQSYLRKCLDSCLTQDLCISDYEIIIIDDGSYDRSGSIADWYAQNYTNVKVFHQKNAGLSVARNNGFNKASGDYVWFVDSDDWIKENCLGIINESLLQNNPDILQIQYQLVYENGTVHQVKPCIIPSIVSGKEVLFKMGLPAPVQFSIFRRLFLIEHSLAFVPNIYHEDSEFKPRATYLANSIISIEEVVYNYFQRMSGSITSHFKVKNAFDIITVNQRLYDFLTHSVSENTIRRCFYRDISQNFNTLFNGCRKLSRKDLKLVIQCIKKNRHLLIGMIKSHKTIYMCEGILFLVSVRLGLFVYKLLKF